MRSVGWVFPAALPTRESLDSLLEPAEPLRPDDPGADEALPDEDESPLMTLKQQAVVAIANAAQACSEGKARSGVTVTQLLCFRYHTKIY
jgi:hypothetical protein